MRPSVFGYAAHRTLTTRVNKPLSASHPSNQPYTLVGDGWLTGWPLLVSPASCEAIPRAGLAAILR